MTKAEKQFWTNDAAMRTGDGNRKGRENHEKERLEHPKKE